PLGGSLGYRGAADLLAHGVLLRMVVGLADEEHDHLLVPNRDGLRRRVGVRCPRSHCARTTDRRRCPPALRSETVARAVKIRLRRPASDDLAQLVVRGRADSLTYEPVGI